MEKSLERREFVEKTKYADDVKRTQEVSVLQNDDGECSNTSEEERENIRKLLGSLKILFNTQKVDTLIKAMIEAAKRSYSPELQVFMGDDYPYFQLLRGINRINYVFRRFKQCAKMGITLEDCGTEKMQCIVNKEKIDIGCPEQKYVDDVKDVSIRNEANAIELRHDIRVSQGTRKRKERFKNILNFWKKIHDSNIEIQLVDAMNEPSFATSGGTITNYVYDPNINLPDQAGGGDPGPSEQSTILHGTTSCSKILLWIWVVFTIAIFLFLFIMFQQNLNVETELVNDKSYQNEHCSLCPKLLFDWILSGDYI